MKNTPKLIALIMTALSVTGCPTIDDIDGIYNSGNNAYPGEELVFSGQQVYQKSGAQYTEDMTLNDNNGGKVEIKGGKFNYTIGTPGNLEAASNVFYNYNPDIFATVSVNNPAARAFLLKFENDLNKGNFSNATVEQVVYAYADKDVTLSGTGETKTYTEDDPNNLFYGIQYTERTYGYRLTLKKGWNVLYMKQILFVSDNPNQTSITRTTTIYLDNPSRLKWILGFK